MKLGRLTLIGIFGAALVSCANPASIGDLQLTDYDQHTKFAISEIGGGFQVTVHYARYQFVPESDVVASACKSQLTAIAWEYAESAGRLIHPVNEQRIRVSMGRNGATGITSCIAKISIYWQGSSPFDREMQPLDQDSEEDVST